MKDWADEAAAEISEWEFEMFRERLCAEWQARIAQIIRRHADRHEKVVHAMQELSAAACATGREPPTWDQVEAYVGRIQ